MVNQNLIKMAKVMSGVEVEGNIGLSVNITMDMLIQFKDIVANLEENIPEELFSDVLETKKYKKANLMDIINLLNVVVIPSYDGQLRKLNRNECSANRQKLESVINKEALLLEGKSTQKELVIIYSKNRMITINMRTGKLYRFFMKSEIKKVVREGMRISVELVDGSVLKYSIKELLDSKHLLNSKRKNKYYNVNFMENGILQRHDIHRIIYLAYVKRRKGKQAAIDLAEELIGPGSKLVIHHINGDYEDNRLENLQCMTRAEHSSLHNKKDI